jgi:transposase
VKWTSWWFSSSAVAGIIMATKVSAIEIDMTELEDALRQAAETLDKKHYVVLKAVVDAYDTIADLVENKSITIARLRKLLFGSPTEKTKTVLGNDQDSPSARVATVSTSDVETIEKTPSKGHGRNGADAYTGAEKIVVRLVGQSPIQAAIYELQKLRCNLCSEIFTAQAPAGIGTEKYDATSGSMVALLKYGTGMPFNRMEGLQANLGIPLPASTQWDIVRRRPNRSSRRSRS